MSKSNEPNAGTLNFNQAEFDEMMKAESTEITHKIYTAYFLRSGIFGAIRMLGIGEPGIISSEEMTAVIDHILRVGGKLDAETKTRDICAALRFSLFAALRLADAFVRAVEQQYDPTASGNSGPVEV